MAAEAAVGVGNLDHLGSGLQSNVQRALAVADLREHVDVRASPQFAADELPLDKVGRLSARDP
jgi:hypothetical protein